MKKFIPSSKVFAFVPVVRGANKLEVRNEGDTADIVLIGAVGKSWFDDSGITEKEFRDALKTIPANKPITVSVNSEGGSVKEGLGIYNAIKDRSADITCKITGYALSIASVFPLAAGKVVSPKSAIWMMHKAWSWNQGNADDMRQAADMLDAHDETLVDIYAEHTGKSKAEIRTAMENETWVKGGDAVAWGLADETDVENDDDSQAHYRPLAKDFISRCKNMSPEILNALSAPPTQGERKTTTQPKQNSPMKKKLLALLQASNVSAASDGKTLDELIELATAAITDEKLTQAKYDEWHDEFFPKNKRTTTPAPAAPAAGSAEDIADIRAQLKRQNETRVSDKITAHVDRGVITKAQAKIYLRDALVSAERETEVVALLDEMEAPEGFAIAGSHFSVGAPEKIPGIEGKALPEVINGFKSIGDTDRSTSGKIITAQGRYNFMKDEWPQLMKSAMSKDAALMNRSGFMPVAANTYSASLVTNFLIMGCITKLGPKFAPLAAFSRDNTVDPFKPLATGQMKFNTTAQDGSTTQTAGAGTNFESNGDSTVTNVAITTAHYFENMHVSDNELNSGLRMEDLTQAKIGSMSSKIMQVVGAIITAANFTATPVIKDPTSFSWADMRVLWGQLKKAGIRNVILDGEYLAPLQNIPTFLQTVPEFPGAGWRNINNWDFIGLCTEWSQSGANIRGFACDPQAIGIITGVPLNPPQGIPGNTLMTTYVTLSGLNVTIAVNVWFSLATRQLYASLDIIMGAAALDTTAGVVIASGTPT
jgi:ATP-dependent Clp protease protease subunit